MVPRGLARFEPGAVSRSRGAMAAVGTAAVSRAMLRRFWSRLNGGPNQTCFPWARGAAVLWAGS